MGKNRNRSSKSAKDEDRPRKRWNPEFFKNRRRGGQINDRPFLESLQRLRIQMSPLDAFLQDHEFSESLWEVERVRKFFRENKAIPDAPLWIDHQFKARNFNRSTSKWLTATGLADVMKQQRSETGASGGTSRHLTFIPHVTPNAIEALIQTAFCHEIEALRTAILQHIGGRSLIRVLVPASGFANYRLLLNIPYLVLEEKVASGPQSALPLQDQVKSLWEDLPCLSLESSDGTLSRKWAIYERRSTLMVFGNDHTRWRGYAFGQTGFDQPPPEDDHESDSEDEGDDAGDDEAQEDHVRYEEDFFVGGGCGPTLDPTEVVWDPRTYFLRASKMRLVIATRAFEYLVRKIEADTNKEWIPRTSGNDSNQMALERITHMTDVFQRLRKHFAQTIRAWSRFNDEGDIGYFADLNSRVAREAWTGIQKCFEKMYDLEQELTVMESTCEASAKILALRLTQENNRLSVESNNMNRAASEHSERAAASAVRSLAAAEDTSRATRVNIQLFVMTTALVIALQYFCSDRALFAFERTPRAFWISIGVLMPSLIVLCSTLHVIDQYKLALMGWVCKMFMEVVRPGSSTLGSVV